jgi:phage tail-like protein
MAAKDFHTLSAFNFVVSITGTEEAMAFSEVSGINTPVFIDEFSEGGENRFTHKLPTRSKYVNLVLKRGLLLTNTPMYKWISQAINSDLASPVTTHNLTLQLKGENGTALMAWEFANAWPVKYNGPRLLPKNTEMAVEEIEFAYSSVTIRE